MKSPASRPLIALVVVALVISSAAPALGLRIPSKSAQDQSLAAREADLATIRSVLEQDEVAAALAAHGLTDDQIHQRLARLSPDEIHALSTQLDQLQAAGAHVPRYIWILLAVLLGVLIFTAIF